MVSVLSFPAYQNKMELGQFMLATWDNMEHCHFCPKSKRVMGMDYLMKLATSCLIGTELGQDSNHKNGLNLS